MGSNFWKGRGMIILRVEVSIFIVFVSILTDVCGHMHAFIMNFIVYFIVELGVSRASDRGKQDKSNIPAKYTLLASTTVKINPARMSLIENYSSRDPRSQDQHPRSFSNSIKLQFFYCSPVKIGQN